MQKILTYIRESFKKTTAKPVQSWKEWAAKRLNARNILIDLKICGYGRTHLIDKVKPFGGGFVVWSKGCSGCNSGIAIQRHWEATKIIPQITHCALLKSGLLTKEKPQVGTLVRIK